MHPLKRFIPKGLKGWKTVSAEIIELKRNKLSVPKVWIPPKGKAVVLLATGLHLEETSGPYLLLSAPRLKDVIKALVDKGLGILIYPIVNQFGLRFNPNQGEKLMRYDENGHNYNDGWGIPHTERCEEVKLVERDILEVNSRYRIALAISLHEDSETPGKGYIYTHNIDPSARRNIISKLRTKIDRKLLATKDLLVKSGQETFQGGVIEEGFVIADSVDRGSLENWLADDLKIPTILSEAPYGLPLPSRRKFHHEVIKGALQTLSL